MSSVRVTTNRVAITKSHNARNSFHCHPAQRQRPLGQRLTPMQCSRCCAAVAPAPVGLRARSRRRPQAPTSSHSSDGVSADPSRRIVPNFVGKAVPPCLRSGADCGRPPHHAAHPLQPPPGRRFSPHGFRRTAECCSITMTLLKQGPPLLELATRMEPPL